MPSIYGNNNLKDWAADFIFANSTGKTSCLITGDFGYSWTIIHNNITRQYSGTVVAGDVVTIDASDDYSISVSYNIKGENGNDGNDGNDGADGVSPTISVTSITGGHTVSITDAIGTNTFNVMDGQDGTNGANGTNGTNGTNGSDGITPTINITSITGGHNVAFDYGSGDSRNANFNVLDGTNPTGAVTSTSVQHIEVVSTLPANPDANTIYIVQ